MSDDQHISEPIGQPIEPPSDRPEERTGDDEDRRGRPIGLEGLKALGDDTRRSIVDLLGDRPATVTELAVTLDKAKGTIAHHVKVLEDAGLVAVVSTRRVRAIEERTYGRTAPTFLLPSDEMSVLGESWMVDDAVASARPCREGEPGLTTVRFARIDPERAAEFEARVIDLAEDFRGSPRGGDVVYGLLLSLFPTDRPHLPDEPEDAAP